MTDSGPCTLDHSVRNEPLRDFHVFPIAICRQTPSPSSVSHPYSTFSRLVIGPHTKVVPLRLYPTNQIFFALSIFRHGSFASLVLIFLYPSPHLSSPCFLQPQGPIIPFIGKGMKPMFSLRSGLAKMLPPSVKGSSPLELQTTTHHKRSLTPRIPAIGMVFFLHTPAIPRTHTQNPRVEYSGAL